MRRRQLVIKQTLFRVQRQLVLHIAREYRIVSHATATVFAGPLTFWLENRPFTVWQRRLAGHEWWGRQRGITLWRNGSPASWTRNLSPIEPSGPLYPVSAVNRQRMAGWPTGWHRCLLVTNVSVNIYVFLKSYHCVVHLDTLASSIP